MMCHILLVPEPRMWYQVVANGVSIVISIIIVVVGVSLSGGGLVHHTVILRCCALASAAAVKLLAEYSLRCVIFVIL